MLKIKDEFDQKIKHLELDNLEMKNQNGILHSHVNLVKRNSAIIEQLKLDKLLVPIDQISECKCVCPILGIYSCKGKN